MQLREDAGIDGAARAHLPGPCLLQGRQGGEAASPFNTRQQGTKNEIQAPLGDVMGSVPDHRKKKKKKKP